MLHECFTNGTSIMNPFTELFELVKFYLEDNLEMAGHPIVTLGWVKRCCTVTIQVPRGKLFESVKLYSGDGLEMVSISVDNGEENDHIVQFF